MIHLTVECDAQWDPDDITSVCGYTLVAPDPMGSPLTSLGVWLDIEAAGWAIASSEGDPDNPSGLVLAICPECVAREASGEQMWICDAPRPDRGW
jgi:hypothetical protein